MADVSLIVMERGSEWPGHIGNTEDIVAMGNDDEELLQRTRQGLASLRLRGQRVRVAVLACNEATDSASVVRRAEVVTELLAAVNAFPFGRLVLSTGQRASAHLRRELLSLAGALGPHLEGSSATVSVRFGGAVDASREPATLRSNGLVGPPELGRRLARLRRWRP